MKTRVVKKRQPPRRQYRPVVDPRPHKRPHFPAQDELSDDDLDRFAFLFDRLRQGGFLAPVPKGTWDRTTECPDVLTILRRCKAKGVDLGANRDPGPPRPGGLAEILLGELCAESNPSTMVALKEQAAELRRGAKSFKEACSRFEKVPGLFAVPDLEIPPSGMFELLNACALVLNKALATAQHLVEGRRARDELFPAKATGLPKKAPGRPLKDDLQMPGVSRDDARGLRRAVRLAASVAPIRYGEGVSVEYIGYPRCQTCNNPAPALFTRSE